MHLRVDSRLLPEGGSKRGNGVFAFRNLDARDFKKLSATGIRAREEKRALPVLKKPCRNR